MSAVTDLFKSERGFLGLVLLTCATVLAGIGRMPVDQWQEFSLVIFGVYVAGKTATSVATIVKGAPVSAPDAAGQPATVSTPDADEEPATVSTPDADEEPATVSTPDADEEPAEPAEVSGEIFSDDVKTPRKQRKRKGTEA